MRVCDLQIKNYVCSVLNLSSLGLTRWRSSYQCGPFPLNNFFCGICSKQSQKYKHYINPDNLIHIACV